MRPLNAIIPPTSMLSAARQHAEEVSVLPSQQDTTTRAPPRIKGWTMHHIMHTPPISVLEHRQSIKCFGGFFFLGWICWFVHAIHHSCNHCLDCPWSCPQRRLGTHQTSARLWHNQRCNHRQRLQTELGGPPFQHLPRLLLLAPTTCCL